MYQNLKNNYPRYKYGTIPPPKEEKKHTGKVKMRMSQVSFLECIWKHHSIVSSPTLLESKRSKIGYRHLATKQ